MHIINIIVQFIWSLANTDKLGFKIIQTIPKNTKMIIIEL